MNPGINWLLTNLSKQSLRLIPSDILSELILKAEKQEDRTEKIGDYLPLHWNLLSGVVSSSLSAISGGPAQRAMPEITVSVLGFFSRQFCRPFLSQKKVSVFYKSWLKMLVTGTLIPYWFLTRLFKTSFNPLREPAQVTIAVQRVGTKSPVQL